MPVPVNIGPSDAARYGWPGSPDDELSAAATRIARHIVRARARIVALLPVSGKDPLDDRLAPVLLRLAEGLIAFSDSSVAIVDTWRTWPWGEAVEWGKQPPTAAAGCGRASSRSRRCRAATPRRPRWRCKTPSPPLAPTAC